MGPKPMHIRDLHRGCVKYIDQALDENSGYATTAKSLSWGNPEDDGVFTNIERIRSLLEDEGVTPISTGKIKGGAAGAPAGSDALI